MVRSELEPLLYYATAWGGRPSVICEPMPNVRKLQRSLRPMLFRPSLAGDQAVGACSVVPLRKRCVQRIVDAGRGRDPLPPVRPTVQAESRFV